MIKPTTIKYADTLGSRIVAYDTRQKKAVLIFKSKHLASKYLFGHRIFKSVDVNRFAELIQRCNDKKKVEDKNVFNIPMTYRVASVNYLNLLGDSDYVVLDNNFINKSYEDRLETFKPRYNEYKSEKDITIGSFVTIKFGKYAGDVVEVLDIEEKSKLTPGTKYYLLNIRGKKFKYKANILELYL